MVSCAQGNHAGRVVVLFFFPWWIEVVIFKIWIPAPGRWTTEADFAS